MGAIPIRGACFYYLFILLLFYLFMSTDLPFVKKELKVVVHNPNNLPTAPYTSFTHLQGDLKTLSKENQTKLKKSILKYGIAFPAFIWQHNGTDYIIDAHQRMKALEVLEEEGYTIPEVPYVQIEAKNKKEAAELYTADEEEFKWKIDGYISPSMATYSAERRGETGLTGSGQECGPLCLNYVKGCRGFVYVAWDNQWIIPGGVVSQKLQIGVMTQ